MKIVFALSFTGAICLAVFAAENVTETLPTLPTATLSVSWADFKELIERIQLKSPEEQSAIPPPYEYAMTRAHYTAEAQAESNIRVEAQLEFEVLKRAGWVRVPLLAGSVAPVAVTLNGEPKALCVDEKNWYAATIDKPGTYVLETSFFVPCVSQEGVVSFSFQCAKTPITEMVLTVPEPEAAVEAPSAVNIAVERSEKAFTAALTFSSTDMLAVNWSLPAVLKEKRETPPPAPEPPSIIALINTLASVNDQCVSCESLIRCEMLRGNTDTFQFELPANVNLLSAEGQGGRWNAQPNGDKQRVEMKINHQVADNYEIALRYEVPLTEERTTLVIPVVEMLDMTRQTGFLGVTARSNAEITANAATAGAAHVEVADLPAAVRAMAPIPIVLAFKYSEPHPLVAVDIKRLEETPMRMAVIDRATVQTLITAEGVRVSQAHYEVRNNTKQFLRVELPKDAEIWSAEVAGSPVKPARDPGSEAVLIPLSKSAETRRMLKAFGVDIVYMEKASMLPAWAGSMTFAAPVTDLLASDMQWEIRVPLKQTVLYAKGDLASSAPLLGGVAANAPFIGGVTSLKPETVMRPGTLERLRAGAHTGGPVKLPSSQDKAPPAAAGVTLQPPAPGELLPGSGQVTLNIPGEGAAYAFRRLMVREGKPLRITLYTCDDHFTLAARGALYIVLVLAGLFGARIVVTLCKTQEKRRRRSFALAGFLGLTVIARAVFAMPWFPLVLGISAAMALGALHYIRRMQGYPTAFEG